MEIMKLKIKNFKGFKSFELTPNGHNLSVFGDNQTGKTSAYDSFLWVLFGKDSRNQTKFDIKPIDPVTGEVKHNLVTEVTVIVKHDGREYELKKTYYEVWTKKRKEKIETFTGNTSDYFIDTVPMTETEYNSKIKGFVSENVFKMLTNPLYFNEILGWEERRKILIEICGDVDPEQIFKAHPGLISMQEDIQRKGLEGYQESLKFKRREMNKQIEDTQTRIDENNKSIIDVSDIDFDGVEAAIGDLEQAITTVDEDIIKVRSGADISTQALAMAKKETHMINIKNKATEKNQMSIRPVKDKFENLDSKKYDLQKEISKTDDRIVTKKFEIKETSDKVDALREKWLNISKEEFPEPKFPDKCPTCGQDWVTDEKEIQKAREEFNLTKSKELIRISNSAKDVHKPLLESQNKELSAMQDQRKDKEILYQTNSEELERVKTAYEAAKSKLFNIEEDEEYIKLSKELAEMKDNYAKQKNSITPKINSLESSKIEIKEEIDNLRKELDKKYQPERAKTRIKELKKELSDITKMLDEIDGKFDMADNYMEAQVEIMTSLIEKHFKIARFKMYNKLVNGGLAPCCELIYKGVPYSSLNNAARINTGIDIINALSKHFNFSAPVFIDNSEAVTKFIDSNFQLIKLFVSEKDKKLRIEG